MFYTVETQKTFTEASQALENGAKEAGFGVLHIHNLGEIFRSKGLDFSEDVKVFEICKPPQAREVLGHEIMLASALPCRVSIYTHNGKTIISMATPKDMFSHLTNNEDVLKIVEDIQNLIINIIDSIK